AAFVKAGWEYELIVCNNNSTDKTAELAGEEGATVVFEPVNQIGRARNTGAAAATGDWLIFVDADSFPSEGLFADVLEHINKGGIIGGGVTVRLDHGRGVANWVVQFWNFISRTRKLMAGSFIFLQLKTFRDSGGFSHELFAGEELELSRRLHKVGRKTGCK